MNAASRSNRSMSLSVTSPCTSSGMSAFCMASSVLPILRRSVTPASLWVVAPAGESLAATTPAAWARQISSGGSWSVRYSVISGSNCAAAGRAARVRCREARARCVLGTGGGGRGGVGGGGRRGRVGHDEGAAEAGGRVRHDGAQRRAVAQVQVPVVGAGDGDAVGGCGGHRRHFSLARRAFFYIAKKTPPPRPPPPPIF